MKQVVDDKPPPPSPAADTGNSGVAAGFTVSGADEEDHGEASSTEVGIEGAVDPNYGGSRPSAGDKYGRSNDHPHLAYIYRGRASAGRDGEGGYAGGDGKGAGDEKPQEQVTLGLGHARVSYVRLCVRVSDAAAWDGSRTGMACDGGHTNTARSTGRSAVSCRGEGTWSTWKIWRRGLIVSST